MANQRAAGKRLIGAQATPDLWEAIDQWLREHPNKSRTQFLTEACLEKLERENIEVDRIAALRDGRVRQPLPEPDVPPSQILKYRIPSRRKKPGGTTIT